MSQLRRCGWQFYLERVAKKPQRPSCPAVAGRLIHSATELVDRDIFASGGEAAPVVLVSRARSYAIEIEAAEVERNSANYPPSEWKKFGRATAEKPNGEDWAWFAYQGIPTSIEAYVAWRLANNHQFFLAEIPGFGPAIEVPFEYYLDGELIRGYVDRVFTTPDGGYIPLDIKSGQKPKTDEQLGLYAAALKAALGWEPTWGFYLYGLKHGVAKLTSPIGLAHWTPEKLGVVYHGSKKLIDQGIFLPSPGEACFSCSVSGHCDFAQAAI